MMSESDGDPPKPKRRRVHHDSEKVQAAIDEHKSKNISVRAISKKYGIPHQTLCDKIKGNTPIRRRIYMMLTEKEDTRLAECLLTLAHQGFGQTVADICLMAKKIMQLRKVEPKSKRNINTPSVSWCRGFLIRHPELGTCMLQGKAKLPKGCIMPEEVEQWFQGFWNYVCHLDPTLIHDPTRIYNAHEIGFSFDKKMRKVITCTGSNQKYRMSSTTQTQLTVVACASGAGDYLDPMIIYPSKRKPSKKNKGPKGFDQARMQTSETGWITAEIFYLWLMEQFIPAVEYLPKPVLLLVNGHSSHSSLLKTSEACRENNIILYSLLSYGSHLMQPLEQSFSAAIKTAWEESTRQHINDGGEAICVDTFEKVFQSAWKSVATIATAEESFETAGIYPFNPKRVLSSGNLQASSARKRVIHPTTPLPQLPPFCIPPASSPPPQPPSSAPPTSSSSSSLPPPQPFSPSSTLPSMSTPFDTRKLGALKDFCSFLYGDVSRNLFSKYFSAVSLGKDVPGDTLFQEFQSKTNLLLSTCADESPKESKASTTIDDTLKIPQCNQRRSEVVLTKPGKTLTLALSDQKLQEALAKENKQKEKQKLVVKLNIEEINRKKDEKVREKSRRQKEEEINRAIKEQEIQREETKRLLKAALLKRKSRDRDSVSNIISDDEELEWYS